MNIKLKRTAKEQHFQQPLILSNKVRWCNTGVVMN